MILTVLVGIALLIAAVVGLAIKVHRRGQGRPRRPASTASAQPASTTADRQEPAATATLGRQEPAATIRPDAGAVAAQAGAASAADPPATRDGLDRDDGMRALLGLLAHELRTPLGAIVGYEELLADGLLGELPERATDAVRRMGTAGRQLRHLIDGLADLMVADDEAVLELDEIDTAATVDALLTSARALAGGRGVQLDVVLPQTIPPFRTDGARLAAALDLAVGAAIRASPGAPLRMACSPDHGGLAVTVQGTALDAARDLPAPGDESTIRTGAGLRLLMATRMLRLLGGRLRLDGSPATLHIQVPPSIDGPPGRA